MPPKSKRFTKKDFLGIRPKVFFRGLYIDIAYISDQNQKVTCIISKKTLKTAVERNTVKRRIMNGLQTITLPSQYSYIFYPKKTSHEISYSLLIEEIKKAFATLH